MASITVLLFAFTPEFPPSWLALILHGCGYAFQSVNEFTLLNDIVQKQALQLVINFYATSFDLDTAFDIASIGPLTAIFLFSTLFLSIDGLVACVTRD